MDECFICKQALQSDYWWGIFQLWKKPRALIVFLIRTPDDKVVPFKLDICYNDFYWAKENPEVSKEVVKSKLIALGWIANA